MSDGNFRSNKQFVPSGVDAQSWIGFEHRIQERRFKALLETIRGAVARRDGVAARIALEEARELRPGAPELEALAARVALLPAALPPSASSGYLLHRGLGAVSMFAVGIGLVVGLESWRSGAPDPGAAPTVALNTPPAEVSMPAPQPLDSTPTPAVIDTTAQNATPPSSPAPQPAASAPPDAPAERAVAATGTVTTPRREEPVGTSNNRAPFRAPVEVAAAADSRGRAPEPVLPASREVPDDYVAPSARSESRPAFTEIITPAPAIAANIAPQPVSVTAPPPVLPATNVATVGTGVSARSDNTRVAQVLNQYARAYGQLDPTAARAVWPTVDERALSRAFASLESQDVSFDRCDIDVKGNVASASCRGTASYVGKIGSRQARTEARQWNFELKLHGDDWKIEKAQAIAR